MSIQIESGVPLAPRVCRREKYPFSKLEVGQSFFVAGIQRKSLYGTAKSAAERTGFEFAVRDDEKDGVEGSRVHRTG